MKLEEIDMEDCLYCDGLAYDCPRYLITGEDTICFWYKYVDRNLKDILDFVKIRIKQKGL